MKKANEELDAKIAKEGVDSVRIDANLGVGSKEENDSGNEDDSEDDVEEENVTSTNNQSLMDIEKKSTTTKSKSKGGEGKEQKIQLEFALGDFDNTPIAMAEKLIAAEKENKIAEAEAEGKDEDERDGDVPIISLVSAATK